MLEEIDYILSQLQLTDFASFLKRLLAEMGDSRPI
jgi:hypothetical protein